MSKTPTEKEALISSKSSRQSAFAIMENGGQSREALTRAQLSTTYALIAIYEVLDRLVDVCNGGFSAIEDASLKRLEDL